MSPPPSTTPPDRSHILTEQRHPRSMNLHALSVAECVGLMNAEDRTVADAMAQAGPALAAFIEAAEPGFCAGGRLIYIGAGTSGRLGALDASEAPPTFCVEPGRIVGIIAGGDAALRKSGEGKEDDPRGAAPELEALGLSDRDTILGIAAGGTTPYVLGALQLAKEADAQTHTHGVPASQSARQPRPRPLTGLLTCSPISRPAAADHLIVIETGPELLTGSTRMKAGTATKLALNTISTTLMVRSGRVYQNLMVDLRATNDKLRDRAARIVSTLTNLPREAALEALDRAGGAAKTAIVMARLGIGQEQAEALLARSDGRLDRILGN